MTISSIYKRKNEKFLFLIVLFINSKLTFPVNWCTDKNFLYVKGKYEISISQSAFTELHTNFSYKLVVANCVV